MQFLALSFRALMANRINETGIMNIFFYVVMTELSKLEINK